MTILRSNSPETPERWQLNRTAVLIAVAFLIFVAAIWATLIQRSSLSHMHVVVQATDSLKIEFLQPDPHSIDHCRALANRVAETMLAQCASCRVLASSCLDRLDKRQAKILSGQPVNAPIMHTPNGAVVFVSDRPELASEACRESERQTSSKVPAQCVAAGVASAAFSLTGVSGITDMISATALIGSFGLILFAAVMSLLASYLALSSKRLDERISREVMMSNFPPNGLANEHQIAEPIEVKHGDYLGVMAKRGFDIAGSVLFLLLLAPLFILVLIKIRLEGMNPIYSHPRIGRGGREFGCLKFQTMIANADQVLKELLERNPAAKAEWDKDFKLKNDPRITPFGAFMRRSSLDELPQLWNVLKGDMSLVGPRPIVREEMGRYGYQLQDYLHVRPGITGIWQVSGRNDVDYSYRVNLDSWYVKNWSLWHDLVILLKTLKVVLKRTGAY